jgi:DNA-binding response OmpR family regulator
MLAKSVQVQSENTLSVKDLKWNVEKRTILIKNRVVTLTSTEFQLLYPLRHGTPVTYADLAFTVYRCAMDSKVRVMLDKHIDRMRSKLRGTGMYIYCVLGYGYMIFPEDWSEECEYSA